MIKTHFIVCLFLLFSVNLFAFDRDSLKDDKIIEDVLWAKLTSMPQGERPSVGVALSGGGARGFAHAGVLGVMEKEGFPIDFISGTSMGAVIGALYASGMGTDSIWRFAFETSAKNISKDFKGINFLNLLIRDKLMSPKYISSFIHSNLGGYSFRDLKIPFSCVAMDFKTGEKIIFNSGSVETAVRASVNLPGVFAPVKYRQRYLVDGGVVDFLPVDAARFLGADWVLASLIESKKMGLPENVFTSLLQVIDIRGSILAEQSAKESDFVIRTQAGSIGVADFDKCGKAGRIGFIQANKQIEKAKRSYILRAFPDIVKRI